MDSARMAAKRARWRGRGCLSSNVSLDGRRVGSCDIELATSGLEGTPNEETEQHLQEDQQETQDERCWPSGPIALTVAGSVPANRKLPSTPQRSSSVCCELGRTNNPPPLSSSFVAPLGVGSARSFIMEAKSSISQRPEAEWEVDWHAHRRNSSLPNGTTRANCASRMDELGTCPPTRPAKPSSRGCECDSSVRSSSTSCFSPSKLVVVPDGLGGVIDHLEYNQQRQQQLNSNNRQQQQRHLSCRRRRRRRRRPLPDRLVMVAAMLLLLVGVAETGPALPEHRQPTSGERHQFWMRQLTLVAPADRKWEMPDSLAEQLADGMARQPDQRKSALLYMDLLAHFRSQTTGSRSGDSNEYNENDGGDERDYQGFDQGNRSSSSNNNNNDDGNIRSSEQGDNETGGGAKKSECLSVSLDELLRAQQTGSGHQNDINNNHLLQANISRGLLAGDGGQLAAAVAQLALDNANLLSQLLIHARDSELARRLASRGLAEYLVSSRLRLSPALGRVHSLGLAFLEPPNLSSEPTTGSWRTSFAPVGRPGSSAVRDLARGRWSHPHTLPPFISHWLGANIDQPNSELEYSRNQSDFRHSETTPTSFGRWFWPHFECHRWLLTFSSPFYGFPSDPTSSSSTATSNRKSRSNDNQQDELQDERPSLRGVAFASIDLSQTHLMDQCPEVGQVSQEGGGSPDDGHAPFSFLAGTHQCSRSRGSQCRQLATGKPNRSGLYLCQCPTTRPQTQQQQQADPKHLTERPFETEHDNLSDKHRPNQDLRSDPAPLLALLERLSSTKQLDSTQLGDQRATIGARLEAIDRLEWISNEQPIKSSQANQLEWASSLVCGCDHAHQINNQSGLQSAGSDLPTHNECGRLWPPEFDWRSTWPALIVLVSQCTCSLVSLCLLAGLLWLRKSRIILTSGWLMLETMLTGAFLLYLSVIVRYFQATSVTCLLEPWLRELGFSIFHGSILIKLYKLLTEFQTRRAHRVHFRDKDQIALLSAIVLIVVGYMSAWTALTIDASSSMKRQNHLALSTNNSELLLLDSAASGLTAHPDGSVRWHWFGRSTSGSFWNSSPARIWHQMINRLAELFSGLIEPATEWARCRKLTWDYVTELSELSLLLFGLYLAYRLRRATSSSDEGHRERIVLSGAVLLELAVSAATYASRHAFWSHLSPAHLLLIYALRCQLTVTPTLALILGPKLWSLGRSKQGLVGAQRAGSMRHRCHLSCELHDHHLNDAMRLHQAMLTSNAALDIGTIDLADMDPDVIQAELKRVYTQLEVLKTKVMRRDNPHISKRRGGRATKIGHRKFSLQAFHPRNIGGGGSGLGKFNGGPTSCLSSSSLAASKRPQRLRGNTLPAQPEVSDLDEETTQMQADTTTLAGEEQSRSTEAATGLVVATTTGSRPPSPPNAPAEVDQPIEELEKTTICAPIEGQQLSRPKRGHSHGHHRHNHHNHNGGSGTDNNNNNSHHHHHHRHHHHRHHNHQEQTQHRHQVHRSGAKTPLKESDLGACNMGPTRAAGEGG